MILISKIEPFAKIVRINYDNNKAFMIFKNKMNTDLKLPIGYFDLFHIQLK
jgi:hypothetical protein